MEKKSQGHFLQHVLQLKRFSSVHKQRSRSTNITVHMKTINIEQIKV